MKNKPKVSKYPDCYCLQRPICSWVEVIRKGGCEPCPYRMSCQNPGNTGLDNILVNDKEY